MAATNATEGQNAAKAPGCSAAAAHGVDLNPLLRAQLILAEPCIFKWSLYTKPSLPGVKIVHPRSLR